MAKCIEKPVSSVIIYRPVTAPELLNTFLGFFYVGRARLKEDPDTLKDTLDTKTNRIFNSDIIAPPPPPPSIKGLYFGRNYNTRTIGCLG